MTQETVYSSASPLRTPRAFLASALRDMRIVPAAGGRLFLRNLRVRYRQSLLRWVWLVLPALVTTGTWVLLNHARVVGLGQTSVPYAAYVATGTVLWQLLVDAMNAPLRQLSAAAGILKQTRLPHEAWIVAGLLDALFSFGVRFVLVAILLAVLGVGGGLTLLLLPVAVAGMLLLGVGVGLLIAVPGLLYQDVGQGLALVIGALFFITPVVYANQAAGAAGSVIRANPITPGLVTARAWILGGGGADLAGFAGVLAGSVVLVIVAWLFYRVAQPHLVARL